MVAVLVLSGDLYRVQLDEGCNQNNAGNAYSE